MRSLRWLFLALMLGAPMAQAGPIGGQEEPAFTAAMTDWLAGREEQAILGFAALAASGNAAARIHLALIDTTPAYQGDWLANLPRDQRIALLRRPGGLSGQSWMADAAETEPLAQAWVTLWDSAAPVDLVLTFARAGEPRAAHMAARQLVLRERRGFDALAADPDFPPGLWALAIRDGAALRLPPGDPGRRLLEPGPLDAQALVGWAKATPEGQALLIPLAALCPDSPDPGADLAAFLAQSGGVWALAWAGPPSANLTDPETYAQSPKAVETLRHLLRAGAPAPEVAGSPCLQGLVQK